MQTYPCPRQAGSTEAYIKRDFDALVSAVTTSADGNVMNIHSHDNKHSADNDTDNTTTQHWLRNDREGFVDDHVGQQQRDE